MYPAGSLWLLLLCLCSTCRMEEHEKVPKEHCHHKDLEKAFDECFAAFHKMKSANLPDKLKDCCISFGTEECYLRRLVKLRCTKDAIAIEFIKERIHRGENCHTLDNSCSEIPEYKRILLATGSRPEFPNEDSRRHPERIQPNQNLDIQGSRPWTFDDHEDLNLVADAVEDLPTDQEHDINQFGNNSSRNKNHTTFRNPEPSILALQNRSSNVTSDCNETTCIREPKTFSDFIVATDSGGISVGKKEAVYDPRRHISNVSYICNGTCFRAPKTFTDFTVAINSGGIAFNKNESAFDPRKHGVDFSAVRHPSKVQPSRTQPSTVSDPLPIDLLLNSTNSSSQEPIRVNSTDANVTETREGTRNDTSLNSTSQEPREGLNASVSNSTSEEPRGSSLNATTTNSTLPGGPREASNSSSNSTESEQPRERANTTVSNSTSLEQPNGSSSNASASNSTIPEQPRGSNLNSTANNSSLLQGSTGTENTTSEGNRNTSLSNSTLERQGRELDFIEPNGTLNFTSHEVNSSNTSNVTRESRLVCANTSESDQKNIYNCNDTRGSGSDGYLQNFTHNPIKEETTNTSKSPDGSSLTNFTIDNSDNSGSISHENTSLNDSNISPHGYSRNGTEKYLSRSLNDSSISIGWNYTIKNYSEPRKPEREGRSLSFQSSFYEFQLSRRDIEDLLDSAESFRKLSYSCEESSRLKAIAALKKIVTEICSSPNEPCSNRREARQSGASADWTNWLNSWVPSTTTTTTTNPLESGSTAGTPYFDALYPLRVSNMNLTPVAFPNMSLSPVTLPNLNLMPATLGNFTFNFTNPLLLANFVSNLTNNLSYDPVGPVSGDNGTNQTTSHDDFFTSTAPTLACLNSVIVPCFLLLSH